jgi:hypothetical protein
VADQQPVAALPVDDRLLQVDFETDGGIVATLLPGGGSLPIEYRIPSGYFLAGFFLQDLESTAVLMLGTDWTADRPSEFLIVRVAVEAEIAVSDVNRITGQQWVEMGPFGTVRLEGSSLFFMSTTPDGTKVARYELPD